MEGSKPPYLKQLHAKLWPHVDQTIYPLPTAWSPKDKYSLLDVSHNNLFIRYTGPGKSDSDAAAIRSNHPIPPICGIYYYEVKIISKGREGYIGIGLCASNVSLNRLPGWEKCSYGYHGDDGHSFSCSGVGTAYGPSFTTGDIIGCCVNYIDNTCFYTKNGIYLGIAFRDVKTQLYPSVGLRTPGEVLEANFGQKPFEFDIEGVMIESQMKVKNMTQQIVLEENLAASFQTSLSKLVCSYLVHYGFSETATVFSQSTREDISEELVSIKNRQKIKDALLEGDIDRVISLTNNLYPTVLETNLDLLFQLKCRKFIELIKQGGASFSSSGSIESMMAFGQELQSLCDCDDSNEERSKSLQDAFSLLAYPDPEKSPVAYLLDSSQREPLANALNSAILESQALPSRPPLEIIVQQAATIIQELLKNGSTTAPFVKISDYL